jgi:hypothetical protein
LLWVLAFFSPPNWALNFLVSGPSPIGLMSGDVTPCLCTFDTFLVLFPTCPPANGQTPKLMESVSFKALFLGLVFVCYDFM